MNELLNKMFLRFYNEVFDPSLPMAISRILNYVVCVQLQIKKNQSPRHKNDIQQNKSTKIILKKNKTYTCIINKKTKISEKNNKRHSKQCHQSQMVSINEYNI